MTFNYENNDQFKAEIQRFFKENKIKQKDISSKLEVSPQRITNILNKKFFRFDEISKMLSAVGYDLIISLEPKSKPESEPEPANEPKRITTEEDAVKKLCEIWGVPYKPRKRPWEE